MCRGHDCCSPFPSAPQSGEASLFEVNIRYVGGLLSAFYLTGEEVSGLLTEGLVSLEGVLDPHIPCFIVEGADIEDLPRSSRPHRA